MKQILLLEGPIQTGKSTFLRRALGPHLAACSGFTSQRLLDDTGATCAFRIGPAAHTPLTAPLTDFLPAGKQAGPLSENALQGAGIFRYFPEQGPTIRLSQIFDTLGVSYLLPESGCPLMLLDEIGGTELLQAPFRDALEEVLASNIPVLGVWKLRESALHMQRHSRDGADLMKRHDRMREQILDTFHGQILYYKRGQQDATIQKAVKDFLSEIFDD